MAKINLCIQYGIIKDKPQIKWNSETQEPISALVYIHLVRGFRSAHDGKNYMKHDYPLIVSFDPKIIKEMDTWQPNDVVLIKGTISTKIVQKPSKCPHCKDEDGHSVLNINTGMLVYVTPIFAQRQKSFATKEEAIEHIIASREVSNIVNLAGTLIKDPVYFKTKHGVIVTQYQIALNRKFRIKTDNPDIRTDWPYVKSYGDQAIEDKMRLRQSSNVIIDGMLQTRNVTRNVKCKNCGNFYEWKDTSMEIVPYDTEYIYGTYLSDEDLEREKGKEAEDIRQELFGFLDKDKDVIEEDYNSEDVDESTVKK